MDWLPLSQRSVAEIRAKAAEYRRMAASARTMQVVGGLLRLADRFDAFAQRCEGHADVEVRPEASGTRE